MKTPEQIRDMEFQSSPVGGYKKSDVDLFLEEIASEVEFLMRQKLEADRKLQEISKKAPEAALSSAGIQNVLVSAQRVAEQLTDDARVQAESIIADANLKLTEAGLKAQEIISEAEKNASLLGKTAEAEATKIIAEAVKKSEEIVASSKESVDLQQKLYDRLKVEVSDFKKKAVAQCAATMELLNQLPDEIPFDAERSKTVLATDFSDPAALLDNAVEESIVVEKSEVTEPDEDLKVDLFKVAAEPEIKDEFKVTIDPEAELAHDDGAILVSASPVAKEEPEEPKSEAGVPDEDYQLTFEDVAVSVSEEKTPKKVAAFVIEDDEEEVVMKKGRISFGDDNDDDDDDDEEENLFFRKKKK